MGADVVGVAGIDVLPREFHAVDFGESLTRRTVSGFAGGTRFGRIVNWRLVGETISKVF